VVSVYYLNYDELLANFEFYPKNRVYVFGNINKNKSKSEIEVNNLPIELSPMEFVWYQNEVGRVASVSIGGLFGSEIWIEGKANRESEYFSVTGFGVSPTVMHTGNPGINQNNIPAVALSTGSINRVNMNFAEFLIRILKERKL
jgi:hypothetical protein